MAGSGSIVGSFLAKPSFASGITGLAKGAAKATPGFASGLGNFVQTAAKATPSFASGIADFAQGAANNLTNSAYNPNSGQIEAASAQQQAAAIQAQQQAQAQAQQQAAAIQAQQQAAAAAEARRIADLQAGFNTQRGVVNSSTQSAEQQAGSDYKNSILDLLDNLRTNQTSLDRQAVDNELARKQGTQGIMGMIGRGIQSTGIILNNKNASDSSATAAIARAYGQLGQQQLSNIGNQYAQGENKLQQAQTDLTTQQSIAKRNLDTNKERAVNSIVDQAQNSLASLNAAMVNTPGITDRIQIEQEKERIRQEAMQALSQYDSTYTQGTAGIHPLSQEERQTQALKLATAGQAPANSFNFTDQIPAQFAGTGPFSSDLPIFTFSRNKQQFA